MRHSLLPLFAVAVAACGGSPHQTTSTDPAKPVPAAADAASANSPTNPSTTQAAAAAPAMTKNDVYSLSTATLDGKPAKLADYRGKVTLVVNVASECGYTPQYAGLQKLHAEMSGRGFAVLGFPSNEFGGQEPGSPEQIQKFCSTKYSVTFPLFAKCATKPGAEQSPVYAALTGATGKSPNWNFCKYLVGKQGEVIAFYPSKVAPDDAELRAAIEKALK
jgi:glutathione peroxidase